MNILQVKNYYHLRKVGQCRIIEQPKFTYSPLGKALDKRTKVIEDQSEKQIKAVENRVKKTTLRYR